jgi:hypothetical protein
VCRNCLVVYSGGGSTLSKAEIQTLIGRLTLLKDVFDAHIDVDDEGEVISIGIFSNGNRHPKEIKRDVEEIFRNQMGYRVNHTKISIVEEIREENKELFPRVKFLTAYQLFKTPEVIEGVVQIQHEDKIVEGRVEVLKFEMDLELLIAQATVNALMKVLPDHRLRVNQVKEMEMGSHPIICISITCTHKEKRDDGIYVGACIRSKDLLTSVSKATLDALNRKLETL